MKRTRFSRAAIAWCSRREQRVAGQRRQPGVDRLVAPVVLEPVTGRDRAPSSRRGSASAVAMSASVAWRQASRPASVSSATEDVEHVADVLMRESLDDGAAARHEVDQALRWPATLSASRSGVRDTPERLAELALVNPGAGGQLSLDHQRRARGRPPRRGACAGSAARSRARLQARGRAIPNAHRGHRLYSAFSVLTVTKNTVEFRS